MTNYNGKKIGGFPHDVIFGKTYISSPNHDAGVIIADSTYALYLWNSDYAATKQLTAVGVVNQPGVSLAIPTLPATIQRGDIIIFILTVYLAGPEIQNTTYSMTTTITTHSFFISGVRTEIFGFYVNWKNGVEIKYKFSTVLGRNKRFMEQRRSLFPNPYRTENVKILYDYPNAQIFLNYLREIAKKFMVVPIYTEPIEVSEDLQGKTELNLLTNIQYLWNLQKLAEIVVIMDTKNFMVVELKKIASLASTKITIENAILGDFKKETTLIFPVMTAILENKSFAMASDNVLEGNLVFREVKP